MGDGISKSHAQMNFDKLKLVWISHSESLSDWYPATELIRSKWGERCLVEEMEKNNIALTSVSPLVNFQIFTSCE